VLKPQPKTKAKKPDRSLKPDRMQLALREHRMATDRLEGATKRSDSSWEQFLSARRDEKTAAADVKRSLEKLSRVCALEMKKAWKDKIPPAPLKCSSPAPSSIKPISITIPMFQEDPVECP